MACLLLLASAANSQSPPQTRFSTHDQTIPINPTGEPGVDDFREWWADTKSPGNGVTYSFGTVEVRTTIGGVFSGALALAPLGVPIFSLSGGSRQITLLQAASTADGVIQWQRYLNGSDTALEILRASNARGVSVWPAADDADTRIAVCGETYDKVMPLSNAPSGWPAATGAASSGFIAMFNGQGDLLWTHHFFGTSGTESCAITDVSVRVEYLNSGVVSDFVTFCGISSHGNPVGGNATLTPKDWFVAPAGGSSPCSSPSDGNADNGAGQWDGIVGRLRHAHAVVLGPGPGATTTTVEFLSIVGGVEQDALFGIADIDEERFAVVGSSGTASAPVPGNTFPFEYPLPICPSTVGGAYSVGVMAVFRAPSGGVLDLEYSQPLGQLVAGSNTVGRDVLMQRNWGGNGLPGLIFVGSTDDGMFLTQSQSLATLGITANPQPAIGGGVDGFVAAGAYVSTLWLWDTGTFRGTLGDEGLVGVQGWNEFYDHIAVTGTTPGGDIDVGSYYQEKSMGTQLRELTSATVGGSGFDRPAAMGVSNATAGSPTFLEFGLGAPAGGGITVDQSARTNVVGTTVSSNYPVTTGVGMPPLPGPLGRPKLGSTNDAVRTALDLLPVTLSPAASVGRTDGTGPAPAMGPVGGYPGAGWFGGTTPECALTPYGHQIGLTDPQTGMSAARMLIDYEGPPPGSGVNMNVVLTRHPASGASAASFFALQLDFPGNTGTFAPWALPDGIMIWVPNSVLVLAAPASASWSSIRFPVALPPGPATFTFQVLCLTGSPVNGGWPTCGATSQYVASPGLWISY